MSKVGFLVWAGFECHPLGFGCCSPDPLWIRLYQLIILWKKPKNSYLHGTGQFGALHNYLPRLDLDVIFSSIFRFCIILNPLKSCILISYTQKIFRFCSTVPLESSITFLNLVLAVLKWAVGRFYNGNRRLH